MLDLGRLLIQKCLESGDADPIRDVERIFDLDGDSKNKQAWYFITDYVEEHGKTPPMEVFRREMPKETYRFPPDADEYAVPELVSLCAAEIKDHDLFSALAEATALFESGDYQAADEVLAGYSQSDILAVGQQFPPVADVRDLSNLPKLEPLIEGVLERGTIVSLNGSQSTGKTFIALDWAGCVASGRKWLGEFQAAKGKVLYVAAEGAYGFRTRVPAWEQENVRLKRGSVTYLLAPVQFGDPAQVAKLTAFVRKGGFDLVVIDTQARSTVGLEENSATDMGFFVEALYRMRNSCNDGKLTILVLHHTGYEKRRGRGSSSLPGAWDGEYTCTLEEPEGDAHEMIIFRCTKRKEGPDNLKLWLRLDTVEISNSESSCVVRKTEEPDATPPTPRQITAFQVVAPAAKSVNNNYETNEDTEAAVNRISRGQRRGALKKK